MNAAACRLTVWLLALAAGTAWASPLALVEAGRISGVAQGDVEKFLGIPYAAPPVGALRWRAPQSVPHWSGVLKATHFGHDCMQTPYPSDAAPLGVKPAEDCLVLNVWRSAGAKAGDRLPVLVWIYGGGNVNGGASPEVYSGESFARHGVMFVSFNYRVGRFGYFAFPQLTREDRDHGLLANYGYMDAIAAMRWVQHNIAALGGDPGQVTIYGQSAGAGQVYMLLTSPLADGLFSRAIIQSGAGFDRPSFQASSSNPLSIEMAGVNFAKRWGIEGTGPEALEHLRALRAGQVTDGLHIGTMAAQASTFVGPVRDGNVYPNSLLLDNFASGHHAKVALLLGSTAGDNYRMSAGTLDEAYAGFGAASERARAAYSRDAPTDPQALIREIGRDRNYREPNRYVARKMTEQGLAAYVYRFNYVVTPMREQWKEGPLHATDIPFSMNTVRAKYGNSLTASDLAMANMVHHYWVNFVRTGNPNGPGLPEWPAYDAKDDVLLDFATTGIPKAIADPRRDRLDAVAAATGRE